MGMKVLGFATYVTHAEEAAYSDFPSWMDRMRSQVARHMAENWLREAARYERIEPIKGGFPMVQHRWTIGVETNLSEIAEREKQMAEARAEGRKQAADYLRSRATQYDRVDGMCKHVLQHQLLDEARAIEKLEDAKNDAQPSPPVR